MNLPSLSSPLLPARALRHGAWWGAVAVLALNDHWLKGSHLLPGAVTGKLSDVAGLFAAPALLATLLRVRSLRGLLAAHAATGAVFAAIKTSAAASGAFLAALALAGISWKNWVDPTDLLALPALGVSLWLLHPVMRGERGPQGHLERLAIGLGLPVMLASGENMGGANSGAQAPGSGDRGVDLVLGNLAVDPEGRYFVEKSGGKVRVADLDGRRFREVPELSGATLLAFWPSALGQGIFVLSVNGQQEELLSYDLESRRVSWRQSLQRAYLNLQVDEGGQRVVAWSANELVALDAADGHQIGSFTPEHRLVDVDLVGDRMIFTADGKPDEEGLPRTEIHVQKASDLSDACASFEVPNCADELVVLEGGQRALLAPTLCTRDPVSVIDLGACQFDRNLPGFGPVALSQNRRTAVAFLDRDLEDPMAPPLPAEVKQSAERFHLMFIDAATLEFGTTPVGQQLPRYAVTPDGQLLLVDSITQQKSDNVRIVDVASRQVRTVSGPSITLEQFVLLPDSSAAYTLHWSALYRLDIAQATSSEVPLSFTPSRINLTPTGRQLLLRDTEQKIHLFDLQSSQEAGVFVAD